MKKSIYFVLCLATFYMVACANIADIQKASTAAALPALNDNSGNCQLIGDGIEVLFWALKDMKAGFEIDQLQQLAKLKAVEMGASHVKFDKEECKITTVSSEAGKQCSVTWKAYKCK